MSLNFVEDFSYDFSKLEAYLENGVNNGLFRNGIAIVYKNKLIYRNDFGFSDYDCTKPAKKDDLFMIYSATKTITCTAAMQLVEKGLIGLDDELYKYIPEFEHMMIQKGDELVPATKKMTIRQLFSMSAGLNYDFNNPAIQDYIKANPNAGTVEIVKNCIAKMPLLFEPGERWSYSFGHDVLAALIEVVSKMTFGVYLKKYIFEPLEMHDTYIQFDKFDNSRLVAQYAKKTIDGKEIYEREMGNKYVFTPNYESGGAGIITTIDDYVSFISALANYGTAINGAHILSPEMIDEMRTNQFTDEQLKNFWTGTDYGYGLGCRTKIKNVHSKSPLGEFGWDGAARAYNMIDVKNNLGLFFDMQVLGADGGAIHGFIRDTVYETLGLAEN